MVDDLKEFTKRAKDVLVNVTVTGRMKHLYFLNVNEQEILESMVKKYDAVDVIFDGGFSSPERRRAVVMPTYISPEAVDSRITLFKIDIIGSGEVTHSQVLGSLMSLDIDRDVIGDITVDEQGAYFTACNEFDAFLTENFTKVSRHDIRLIVQEEPVEREVHVEEMDIIVSSMRLDVIVKALIQNSRSKAEEYIDAGFVRHNHMIEKKVTRICHIGDILSISKYGRFKIVENKKTTKSGKHVLVVSKSI